MTDIARTTRRAAVTVAVAARGIVVAPALAYRAFVIDRARDDIKYTSWRARRAYRVTWEPRHSHRRPRSTP